MSARILGLRLHEVLKLRPLVLQILEELEADPWPYPEWQIHEILERFNIPSTKFDELWEKLPQPSENKEWKELPIYHLIDLLVWQHKESQLIFRDISSLMEIHCIPYGDESDVLREIHSQLRELALLFSQHSERQDKEVFMRILRSDFCHRMKNKNPDFHNTNPSQLIWI